jgi:prolipoprotein diacylglyceryltransferase
MLEVLAYAIGARIYWRAVAGLPHPEGVDRWLLFGATVFGAALGSKLLHVAEHLPTLLERGDLALWIGGKSVLGGFLGGTLGVELAKRVIKWPHSTGDAWVPALTAGLAIGRLGCQLSGTWDQTYGNPTGASWGWDYGDGVLRHPVGLYEIAAVLVLFALVRARWRETPGARFAAFMGGYAVLRFALEWVKPPFGPLAPGTLPSALYAGLTAIQWAALLGVAWFALLFRHRRALAAPRLAPT